MLKFLLGNREGRFLILGSLLMLAGYLASFTGFNQLSQYLFYAAIFFLGFFAAKDAIVETIQDRSPNVDLLMILAALGAVLINFESEGAMLLFIFAAAETLEEFANDRSSQAITELMSQVPQTAQLITKSGDIVEVATEELKVGDMISVSKGSQVPIDGQVDRQVEINEAALTGESVPVSKDKGAEVFAGTLNEGNTFQLKVTKTFDETVFSNIIRMVEEAENRPSKISRFIDRIESKYVVSVLIAVPIFIILLYTLIGLSFTESFYRGMVFLTVASPCALVASATPATLSAISNGAKNGILFKGGVAMEALNSLDILYTDKTGTLTFGHFELVDYQVEDSVLKEVVFMEQQSSHPIAEAITLAFQDLDLSQVDASEPVEEVAGSGIKKGAIKVGKPAAFESFDDPQGFRSHLSNDLTTIFIGRGNEVIGYMSMTDQIRDEAVKAIEGFQAEGVQVVMLTGDNPHVAQSVANSVGIDEFHASMLPEDKIQFVMEAQNEDQVIGMIGDGINDAPALANADIGIAMGSGSSVAMESSDVVIVKNNLIKLFESFKLSQKLERVIKQNVTFALSVIVILVLLSFFGLISLPFAVLFHEGSTILVIFNGLRLLKTHNL